MRTRTQQHAARRVRQTMAFANGPRVLWDIATSRAPWGRSELKFAMRDGSTIVAPNQAGARVPVYEIFIEDAYRLEELTEGLRPDFVAMDVGGQLGCFSVALAKAAPAATVHTYEASPTTATWLQRNVDGNGLAGRVIARHTALSDHRGTLEFADLGAASGLNGLTAPAGSQTVVVPCITFADAVAEAGGRVDLVKMDTEGAEYDIILGGKPTDWATVQRVTMEYHPVEGHSWSELEEFFTEAGLVATHHEQLRGFGMVMLARNGASG